jgi:addiction module HigA family antidote
MAKKIAEVHPGEILSEEFLKPMGITNARLAGDIDVPTSRISEIVNQRRPITVDTAMRLAVFFNMEARFWLNLQAEYDIRIAEKSLLPEIKSRIRPFQNRTA